MTISFFHTVAVFVVAAFALPARAASYFEPQLDPDDHYSETFTAIADLKDGSYAQVQLNFSNFGPGDSKGACRILVVPNNGKAWTVTDRVDHDEWSVTGDTVKVKTCSMTGGAKSFADQIAIAWSAVEASMTLPGQSTKTVSGFGYLDHARSTTKPPDLASRWIRFRAINGGDSWLLLARTLPDGSLRGWTWRQKDTFARPLKTLEVERLDKDDQAKGYIIEGEAGAGTFKVTVDKQLYRYAPVEEYGVLGALARPIVGNPVTRTYRATLELSENGAALPATTGILEVQHVR